MTINDSLEFFTSLTNCRYLKYLGLSRNHILSTLPKSIGNITSEIILLDLSLAHNQLYGSIPTSLGEMVSLIISLDLDEVHG